MWKLGFLCDLLKGIKCAFYFMAWIFWVFELILVGNPSFEIFDLVLEIGFGRYQVLGLCAATHVLSL